MKFRLKELIDYYEWGLKSEKTDRMKYEYIGEIGECIYQSMNKEKDLYTLKFNDGQLWCCDGKQLERVKE